MSDIQMDEFRSRVDKIERNMGKSRRNLRRDRFGVIQQSKGTTPKSAVYGTIKVLFKLCLIFTVTKAVMIYHSDQAAYQGKIEKWSKGAGVAPIMSIIMAPDYFTGPIHVMIDQLSDLTKSSPKK